MLFQIYGETALYQLLGFVLVFTGLVLANEFARRTKTGGIICFLVLPAVLTVYFIAIAIGAHAGAEWALNNQTYTNMNSWFHYAKLYAATAGCIGFMMLKYKRLLGPSFSRRFIREKHGLRRAFLDTVKNGLRPFLTKGLQSARLFCPALQRDGGRVSGWR